MALPYACARRRFQLDGREGYPHSADAIELLVKSGRSGYNLPFTYVKNLETAQLLIAAGADINKKGGDNGETALMVANAQTQSVLLKAGADIQARDD